tara:strand:- start:103 stop:507 length:405 start_codon:yes stop_codon:yes gene_type:complete
MVKNTEKEVRDALEGISFSPYSGEDLARSFNERSPIRDSNGQGDSNMKGSEVSGSETVPMTPDEAFNELGFGPFQARVLVLCGLCWLVDGMEVMILSFLLPELREEWDLGSFEEGSGREAKGLHNSIGSFLISL